MKVLNESFGTKVGGISFCWLTLEVYAHKPKKLIMLEAQHWANWFAILHFFFLYFAFTTCIDQANSKAKTK